MKKLIVLISSIVPLIAWLYAVIERFTTQDWIMLVVDIVIPPVGVIDGIGLYLGLW